MATILIPTPLRKFTGNAAQLTVDASDIRDAVNQVTEKYPDVKKHLLDEKGQIRSFINIFVGEDDIRDLQQEQTSLQANTEVSIIPAIAGGI